jgi:hypothetical protein
MAKVWGQDGCTTKQHRLIRAGYRLDSILTSMTILAVVTLFIDFEKYVLDTIEKGELMPFWNNG